jgi:hypothetical protein
MKAFIDVYSSATWYNFIRREEESSGADRFFESVGKKHEH